MFSNSGIQGEFNKKDFYDYPVTEKYDIVICQAVLRHVGNSERFISKMLQHEKKSSPKAIYMYPLQKDFKDYLKGLKPCKVVNPDE